MILVRFRTSCFWLLIKNKNISEAEDYKFSASSTQIAPKVAASEEGDPKLELIKILKGMNITKFRHSSAIKKIPWASIKIDGYSQEELQEHLNEIIKTTGVIRTLDEVLADYQKNQVSYSINNHKDFPKRPSNANICYITKNRRKLEEQLEKMNPGKKIVYVSQIEI